MASISDQIIARLEGVYVHPGKFAPTTTREDDRETWERYRDRLRRLRGKLKDPYTCGPTTIRGQGTAALRLMRDQIRKLPGKLKYKKDR